MKTLTIEELKAFKLHKSNLNLFAASEASTYFHVTEILSKVITEPNPVHIKQVYSIGSLGASAFFGEDFYKILRERFPNNKVYLLSRKGYDRITTIEEHSIFLHYANTSERYYVAVDFEPLDAVLQDSQKTYRKNVLHQKDTKKLFETLIEPTLTSAIEKENEKVGIKRLHYDPMDKKIYITPGIECIRNIKKLLTEEYGNILHDSSLPFKLDVSLDAKFVIDIDTLSKTLLTNKQ